MTWTPSGQLAHARIADSDTYVLERTPIPAVAQTRRCHSWHYRRAKLGLTLLVGIEESHRLRKIITMIDEKCQAGYRFPALVNCILGARF